MFILPILLLTLIYIKFGLFVLIQILIWSLVFILSNFLIQFNPNREMYIIRILSILVIMFILYYNSLEHIISTALIIPLSISKISLENILIKIYIKIFVHTFKYFYYFKTIYLK